MKELMRYGLSLGVCSEKPTTPILISNGLSNDEGRVGLGPSQFPASLVPYSDSEDEIVITTPLFMVRLGKGGFPMADKAK